MTTFRGKKDLSWDDILSNQLSKEWSNTVKQANSAQTISIKRSIGSRSDRYRLLAFAVASKQMYGVVIYMQNLKSNEVTFIQTKNRIVSENNRNISISALELQAVVLATDSLINLYNDLTGKSCVCPIDISSLHLCRDSLVTLSWINGYTNKYGKM